jgi:arginyl-tRNA synthetase
MVDDYKNKFALLLNDIINSPSISKNDIFTNIRKPPKQEQGDLSFTTFQLSKIYKKSPKDIATNLVNDLSLLDDNLFDFNSLNGYVNAKINHKIFIKNTLTEIFKTKKKYGYIINPNPKQYVIDTFQPNPLKMLHIGHIRNGIVGESINNLLLANGDLPIPVSYMGDIGTHVAKWLWYYNNFVDSTKKNVPEKEVSKWFGNIYLAAGKKLDENPDFKKDVDDLQVNLMTDEKLQNQLKIFVKASFNGYMDVAKELNLTLKDNIFESACEVEFNKIKPDLFNNNKNIFIKDDGAIVANLNDKNLGNFILIKTNGALLYGAKDIGLINIKKHKYPSCNDFLYVVASEQEFYFSQLFRLFDLIYPKFSNKHINFGLITTSKGKMKSREGQMILYEDFRDDLYKTVKSTLLKNGLDINSDIVKDISFGTIKFEMLKIAINKNILFDLEVATDLQGDSSAYIQYSGVRAQSILQKSNSQNILLDLLNMDIVFESEEISLVNKLYEYKEKLNYASINYKPNVIANYCLELVHIFNKFYNNCQVLHSDDNIKNNRLLFTSAFLIVIKNALNILGINIPSAM